MKNLKIFTIGLVALLACGFASCHKGGNTPVDQFVELMDEATKKAEKINSVSELQNVQDIISQEDALKIVRENPDYVLTNGDKDKIKKSYDKLLRTAYEKTAELSGFPEEIKQQSKAQIELIIDAANKGIDNATTLGDLSGMQ